MNQKKLLRKNIIISAAADGIGWAIAKACMENGAIVYLSDKNPRVIEMKPGIYHGYKSLEPGSILCYYLTEKYNPEDEIRAKVGDFGEDWEVENK